MTLSLPPQPTSFVGRQSDLDELGRLLTDPNCRLLSLVGPGGAGKTRLAIAAATQQQPNFSNGVFFVSLQGVSSATDLPGAIANTIGQPLAGAGDAWQQLSHLLQDKQLLLVLDNLEHLAAETNELATLLMAAPELKMLVTSRVSLNVQEEWRFPVGGLSLVPEPAQSGLASSDAERLFAERARRVNPGFSPAAEQAGISRVCRLVDGLPLAIELAAAWTEALSCHDIANGIERDLSLLTTRHRNVADRHHSMRVVFDSTWQLLSAEEQTVFTRLAIFRGGFGREAAAEIAGATWSDLASLTTKALVRYEADGRYHIHELLRQYAWEHLHAQPDVLATVEARHSDYFRSFLEAQGELFCNGGQRQAMIALGVEADNLRAAWKRAVTRADAAWLLVAIEPITGLFHFSSRYLEGIGHLEDAVAALEPVPPSRVVEMAQANANRALGFLLLRVGRFDDARRCFVSAQFCYIRYGCRMNRKLASDPEIGLGQLALIRGDYALAAKFGEDVCRRGEAEGNPINIPYGWNLQTQAALGVGDFDSARRAAQAAQAAAIRSRDDWFLAYCLNDLGTIAVADGNLAEGRERFLASYAIRESFDDAQGMAIALRHLGEIALTQGNVPEARSLSLRGLDLYEQLGDQGGLASVLQRLGRTEMEAANDREAREYLIRAITVASAIDFAPLLLSILADAARLLQRLGRPEPAITALIAVSRHPLSERDTRLQAGLLLAAEHVPLDENDTRGCLASEPAIDVRDLAVPVLTELAIPVVPAEAAARAATPGASELIVPLTGRELDVLRLIATGSSNQQIADELFLTVSTVKWYAGQIFGKLQVQNRTGAATRARALGLVA